MTTVENVLMLSVGAKTVEPSPFCSCTNSTPAAAAMKPEIANAETVVRTTLMPYACAAFSFSRIAIRARPVRLLRIPRAASMISARMTRLK